MKAKPLFQAVLLGTLLASPYVLAETTATQGSTAVGQTGNPSTATGATSMNQGQQAATDNAAQGSTAVGQTGNPSVATGATSMSQEQQATTDNAIQSLQEQQNQLLEVVNESVNDALAKVTEATRLLQQEGKEKEAIAALQDATGKFDTAIAAKPELALVPVDGAVTVSELLATPDSIKADVKLAAELLEDNQVQAARQLLAVMQDEMVSSTTYLPMATYPDAIKEATKALIAGNKQEAQAILSTALSTLVTEQSIIPLGVVRAEALLSAASEMDKDKEKDKIKEYIAAAEGELEMARLLGYTDKHSTDYETIKQHIKDLKKEMGEGNAVEKFYDKIKASFSGLMNKSAEKAEQPKPESSSVQKSDAPDDAGADKQ